jgi:hypothetical protein
MTDTDTAKYTAGRRHTALVNVVLDVVGVVALHHSVRLEGCRHAGKGDIVPVTSRPKGITKLLCQNLLALGSFVTLQLARRMYIFQQGELEVTIINDCNAKPRGCPTNILAADLPECRMDLLSKARMGGDNWFRRWYDWLSIWQRLLSRWTLLSIRLKVDKC